MIQKEPESPWWLVCANLVDDERVAEGYWSQWMASLDLKDISGHALLLATLLYHKWPDSTLINFDPRIGGNARKVFYQNTQYLKACEEIGRALDEKGIAHAWLRESGMRSGYLNSGKSLPIHQLECCIHHPAYRMCARVLTRLGWNELKSTTTAVDFTNSDHLRLRVYLQINPHWTQDMHVDLLACISKEASGIGLLLDILSQIQLERIHVDWLRIFESMLLLRHLISNDKWQSLTTGAMDFLVAEPLQKVYCHLVEIFPDYSQGDVQVSREELRLHATYADYKTTGSLLDKARYHLARYNAINSVSNSQLGPLNYVLATRSNRKVNRS